MTVHAHAPGAMPTLEYGRVAARSGERWSVQAPGGCYDARRAKSCLLAPEVGDSVLLCTDDLGCCHILAVLDGADSASTLEFQGHTSVQVDAGSLSLAAAQEISLASNELRVCAHSGSAVLESFSCLADSLRTQCRSLSLAADACQQSLRSLTQRLGSFFRATEGHEEIQAGSARTMVEDTRVLHCKNSVLMAEEDARIDAEQIQLG